MHNYFLFCCAAYIMGSYQDLVFGALIVSALLILHTMALASKVAMPLHEAEHETVGRPMRRLPYPPRRRSYPPPPLLDTAGVMSEGCVGGCAAPEQPPPKLYHSDDIDELVTGTLYRKGERERVVYGSRTSHGDSYGLEEYADGGGGPGDVGYDVGPIGVAPAGGAKCARKPFDDGIPANWNLPSTPMQWYAATGEDYYGSEGPTVYCGAGLEMVAVGDHEPLEG